ncbi:hypothetical protein POM88_023041 [Heracleum sosnowskyi]|uniref:Uncharacterized protein n=1 Tax=Heracleum sosnowskyi TaxID=360622 RepID=A0AAD8MU57_9APIA|nr:hypothetical protein POM88_023041 [Heracleum sosnowskyi]
MLELLLANVKGKDISGLIASGKEKMASVLSGCGRLGSDNLGGAAEAKIPEKIEEKKEEKAAEKDEESEESVSELQTFRHQLGGESLSLLVVGDWGRRGAYNQSQVAHQGFNLSF